MESAQKLYKVVNRQRSTSVATRVRIAGTSHDRRRGLLDQTAMPEDAGLWIVPCEAIHTFGMQVPIDAIFLDKQRVVRKLSHKLQRFRMAMCLRGHSVLELAAGAIERSGTQVGDRLEILEASED